MLVSYAQLRTKTVFVVFRPAGQLFLASRNLDRGGDEGSDTNLLPQPQWSPMSQVVPDQRLQFIKTSAALLNALCNASRLEILTILCEGEISVAPLGKRIGLSQSALSQHLSKLRDMNLVKTRRDAQTVYYHCESAAVGKILTALSAFFGPDDNAVSDAA